MDAAAQMEALAARLGPALLARRLTLEAEQDGHHYRRRSDAFRIEHLASAGRLIDGVLALTGLRARGLRNTLDLRVRQNDVVLARLPAAFDGFRLLQLSDLHIDLSEAHAARLADCVRHVACDACVLTGDYRFATGGGSAAALAALERLAAVLPRPAYAVLGNHDGIALLAGLEGVGVRVLMNENAAFERAGQRLFVAGIDAAHYFRTHDLARAAAGLPAGACTVLLSHTPQPYADAAAQGFDLMLCGHTHGGQICLPGGIPVLTDCPAPRRFARGAWRHADLAGYTSAGCGCSVAPARFFCPPEVVVHVLRRRRA